MDDEGRSKVGHLGRSDGLGPGQLPDVKPGAVSVVKKETQGKDCLIF